MYIWVPNNNPAPIPFPAYHHRIHLHTHLVELDVQHPQLSQQQEDYQAYACRQKQRAQWVDQHDGGHHRHAHQRQHNKHEKLLRQLGITFLEHVRACVGFSRVQIAA
jgi:hypothetical protein